MPVVKVEYVYGYQCFFCSRKFAVKGEKPEAWRETMCSALGFGECDMERRFWYPMENRRRKKADTGEGE